ncbi:RNA polymerase II transcription factor SIII subunit A-domain-containing protein [Nemania sp. FL0916]|nr:RNA polymerase II transcription factor SIII subunit A-domain-containing protein [Nemania sp. FL0916]
MVKSLVELCTTVCLRHVKDITDVGCIPYTVAKPILTKIDSAAQLRQIEVNSPHLEGETAECWQRLIDREFHVLARRHNYAPSNPKSWHKIYAKYQRMDADAKQAAEEKLKNAYKGITKEKAENVSRVVTYDSRKLPRLPRDVRPQVGTRPKSGRTADQSELRWSGGSRTKTNTPKSLLKRAMREAKEISSRNRLNIPTGAAQVRLGQIARAPVGMVQEKIKSARPLIGIRPPTRIEFKAQNREQDSREARLRKAKGVNSHTGESYISDDDLEDLDIEGDDGHFGLEIDDLEALGDEGGSSSHKGNLQSEGSGSGRGGVSARKAGSSSAVPSTSKMHTEIKNSRPPQPRKEQPTRSTHTLGPASPPLRPVVPSSSSTSPGSAPMLSRKRKAVDIFMKQKPKIPRP